MTRLLATLSLFLFVGTSLPAADEPTVNGLKAAEWAAMAKDDPLPRKRRAAVIALGQLLADKPSLKETILPVVAKALRNDSAVPVRLQAAVTLGQLPADTIALLITDLSEALRSEKDTGVKKEIATAVGHIGKAAQSAVLPLIEALKDKTPATRAAAADALGRIGAGANAAAGPLVPLTTDPNREVRCAAVFALGRVDPADPDQATTAIAAALTAEATRLRPLTLLTAIAGGLPAHQRDPELTTAAVVSLGLLGNKTGDAARAVAAQLGDPDADVRQQAMLALGKLGVAARVVDRELRSALNDDADKLVRMYASQTLFSAYGLDAAQLVPYYGERLKVEPDFEVRVALLDELGSLGPNGTAAIPLLRDAQRDSQVKVREAAAAALKSILKPAAAPKP